MSQYITHIRVKMNGKGANLGIIADEKDIKEHFEFVQGLLEEKERADRLERRWEMLKDYLQINSKKWEPLYPGGAGICEELVENDDIKISNVLSEMHDLERRDKQ